jgi:hypothetical protein
MKNLSLTLLLLTTHLPLYLMDDNVDLWNEKDGQAIEACIKKCKVSIPSYDRELKCTDICTTFYKCAEQKKLTKAILTQFQAQQFNKN